MALLLLSASFVQFSERSVDAALPEELASTLTRLETPACSFRGQHGLILILIRGSIGLKNVGIVQKRADWREDLCVRRGLFPPK